MRIVFQNSIPKIPKWDIFGQKLKHACFFHRISQFDKLERAAFKYDDSFIKVFVKKYPSKEFLVPCLSILISKFINFHYVTKFTN